ncbi:MAG TPA: hypothetical protein VFL92_05815 [Sphingomonas sp.]|nr:hypothetical protein [Sphingomonas sp.]
MDQWLRVDCDYFAEGLWDERGRMISLSNVPISQPLRRRILAWQEWYDEKAEPEPCSTSYDWELHDLVRIDIARALKRELPDWTIVAGDILIRDDGSMGERVPYPGEHLLR